MPGLSCSSFKKFSLRLFFHVIARSTNRPEGDSCDEAISCRLPHCSNAGDCFVGNCCAPLRNFLLAMTGILRKELLVSISNPPFAKVIRGKLDGYAVALQDFDVVHPHLAGDPSEDFMAVFQLDAKRCVRQRFCYDPIDRDRALFGHLILFCILIC
jgi:hypothetical protein